MSVLVALLLAHPGSGIVVDAQETVYFVDTYRNRILRQKAGGKPEVFVEDVAGIEAKKLRLPHHLALDARGNLYTAGDTGGVVWRITPDGEWVRHAQRDGLGFGGDAVTVDRDGNVYYGKDETVRKLAPDGTDTLVATAAIGHTSTLVCGAEGALFVTLPSEVRKIAPDGRVATVAKGLKGAWGLCVDGKGRVYVAEIDGRRVKRIGKNGEVETIHESKDGWEPCGVAVSGKGSVFVLEHRAEKFAVRKLP